MPGFLDNIVVDGATDTPDFRIAISGRPVPLHTDFHAIVDGTSGDTYLQPVKAKILDSWLTANGSVVRTKDPKGHHVELDVVIEKGKIDDLLKLAIRTDPPIMTGAVRLKTHFDSAAGGARRCQSFEAGRKLSGVGGAFHQRQNPGESRRAQHEKPGQAKAGSGQYSRQRSLQI